MYKFRKQISFLLTLIMVTSCTPLYVFANQYLTRTEAANLLVTEAVFYNSDITANAILTGKLGEDKDNYVNRIDFLVMVTRAFDNMPDMSEYQSLKAPEVTEYTDVPQWAMSDINILNQNGILCDDGDKLLKPDENITVDEANTIIKRVWNLYGTNPKDDFASYVIKADNKTYGTVSEAAYIGQQRIYGCLTDICIEKDISGQKEKKIFNYLDAFLDLEEREKQGIKPIKKYIDAINNAKTHKELENALLLVINETKLNLLFTTSYIVDYTDSNKLSCDFSVYPATFYKDELEENYTGIENAFKNYIGTAFETAGQTADLAKQNSNILFEQEVELANKSLSVEDYNDPSKYSNKYDFKTIFDRIKVFDMEKILKAEGVDTSKDVYISDVGLYNFYIDKYLDGNHLEDLKRMALINLMACYSDVLTVNLWLANIRFEYEQEGGTYYKNYSDGELLLIDALDRVEIVMEPYLEEIYCKKYYSDAITAKINKLIKEITTVYAENISQCSWMSDATKKQAIKKLKAIKCKVGHPEKFDDVLNSVEILSSKDDNAIYLNELNINKAYHKYAVEFGKAPINKNDWTMCSYEVNAVYSPSENSIYIPAGILSPAMYNSSESEEETLAKIGYVIAHEISHAFDVTGSQYDEKGNLSNWWTDEDKLSFDKLSEKIVKHYDNYEAFNGLQTKGSLTVGENFADICALDCMLEILSKRKNPDYDSFFKTYALTMYSDESRGYEEHMNIVDVHARGYARINPVVCNFDEFYNTYNVSQEDGMYISSENRIKCWE